MIPKVEILRFAPIFNEYGRYHMDRPIRFTSTDLPHLVLAVLAMEGSKHLDRGTKIEADFEMPHPQVHADAAKLKEVILNLYKNAAEAMPNEGIFSVQVYTLRNQAVLEVKSAGKGVAEHSTVPVTPKAEVSQQPSRGLDIPQRIAAAHGGTITCSRQSESMTYKLCLPLVTRDP